MLTLRLGSDTQKDKTFTQSLINEIINHSGSCDEVWFATDYGFPPLEKHKKSAEILSERAQKFREAGIRVSLQLSNSIGHGQYMRSRDCTGLVFPDSPVGKMTDACGTQADYCFCWNDDYFRNYTFSALKYYLEAVKPYRLWVDDDLRATNHAPVEHGCFCKRCIKLFNEKYGTDFDRETLAKAINEDTDVRQKHIEFLRDTLADFTRELGKTVKEASPDTAMGWQGCANGAYTGYGYDFLFDAMLETTGKAPGSRPGGGSYNDYSPADFINKSTFISYQNLMLPDYVKDRRPEIESLPDVVFGKSIPGTCFETSVYLACGNTAMSYAILMNDYEPMSWHGQMLGAFSEHRRYWEKLSQISKTGEMSGLTPFFPKTAYLFDCKEPFDYCREEIFFAEPLKYLAVPVAFTNREADVYVINGRIAETLSAAEADYLLTKNVVCDGSALKALHERGFLPHVNAKVVSVQERKERFTDNTVNRGFEGRTWGGQIWRQTDYELEGEFTGVISEYFSASTGKDETLGTASAFFDTKKGGRWAAFGFDMWARTKSTEKRTQLLRACRELCSRPFIAELETPFQCCIIPFEDENGRCTAVTLINCTTGQSGETKLTVRRPKGKRFVFLGQYVPETVLSAVETEKDTFELTLPSFPGWSTATVFCE